MRWVGYELYWTVQFDYRSGIVHRTFLNTQLCRLVSLILFFNTFLYFRSQLLPLPLCWQAPWSLHCLRYNCCNLVLSHGCRFSTRTHSKKANIESSYNRFVFSFLNVLTCPLQTKLYFCKIFRFVSNWFYALVLSLELCGLFITLTKPFSNKIWYLSKYLYARRLVLVFVRNKAVPSFSIY